MENKRVDFTTAKLAKEKGFDFYNTGGYYHINEGYSSGYAFFYSDVNEQTESCLLCPDQSLLQKWLRDKHKIYLFVQNIIGSNYLWYYYTIKSDNFSVHEIGRYHTYEEALENALVECLRIVPETAL